MKSEKPFLENISGKWILFLLSGYWSLPPRIWSSDEFANEADYFEKTKKIQPESGYSQWVLSLFDSWALGSWLKHSVLVSVIWWNILDFDSEALFGSCVAMFWIKNLFCWEWFGWWASLSIIWLLLNSFCYCKLHCKWSCSTTSNKKIKIRGKSNWRFLKCYFWVVL